MKRAGQAHGRQRVAPLVLTAASSVAAFLLGATSATGAGAPSSATGFAQPYAGTPKFEKWAPTEATNARQVNRPLGVNAADRIARHLGLDKQLVFTPEQYALFVSGQGVGGDPASAKLVDESVRILTNTTGNPLFANVNGKVTPIVLGSYGLMVNTAGVLMSVANQDAPTRQVNSVIAPGGYLDTWCRNNGCERSLAMLHRSAYASEIVFATAAQQTSGAAQLVPNVKPGGRTSTVGMSLAPSIWIVNFALLYVLNPSVAANMPASWTPIPADVAQAIAASSNGQVPYSQYESSFTG